MQSIFSASVVFIAWSLLAVKFVAELDIGYIFLRMFFFFSFNFVSPLFIVNV